jgi:hypothetical protein
MQHTQSSSDATEQLVDVNETEQLIELALGQLPPATKNSLQTQSSSKD